MEAPENWKENYIKALANKPFRLSNGTEGMGFIENYCMNCIHEKFMHTNDHDDKKCEVLNNTFVNDDFSEWFYDENANPYCRCFKRWDWGTDDGENGLNEPPPPEPYDPNQLVFPFITDDILKIINNL